MKTKECKKNSFVPSSSSRAMVSLLTYLRTSSLTSMMKMKLKVAQLCLTLCNPMDYTVHGILQARILEWVAFPFSRGSSQPRG